MAPDEVGQRLTSDTSCVIVQGSSSPIVGSITPRGAVSASSAAETATPCVNIVKNATWKTRSPKRANIALPRENKLENGSAFDSPQRKEGGQDRKVFSHLKLASTPPLAILQKHDDCVPMFCC